MHQNIFKYIAFSLALIQLVFISAVPSAMAVTNIGTDISTNGNLTVDGALQFINGAVNNYILKTDGAGNATWAPVGTTLGTATADDLPAGVVNTYYDPSREGAANGIATLDAGGQIPSGQIPAMAINSTYVVATIAARNVLAANEGDIAIVTDAGGGASRSYIWDGSSWIELLTPLQLYLAKSNNLSDLANFAAARTNLSLGLANSPTFTGLNLSGINSGSVLFGGAGGALSQNNTNLFWDNANNRLGIGTNTPAYTLDVNGDIKAGDGSLLYLGAKADPDPAGTNGAMYYNTTNSKFRCFESGVWKDCISTVAGVALSSISPAVATNTINNGDNAQTWNWSLTTAGKKGFTFGENIASTATGTAAILQASTLAGSTAMPLFVENLGDGDSFRVNDSSGDVTPFLINNNGNVAIGSNSFDPVNPEKLKVDSGNDPSFNIITATGNLDNYLQMNIRNRNSGSNASSDIVATADNGTEDVNYVNMGINSSGYNVAEYSIGGPNDSYLTAEGVDALTPGGNLSVGTGTEGKVIKFHTGGNEAANERMRIDGDGLIGIATTTPGSELDVKGELRLSGATSGYVGLAPAAAAGSTTYTLPAADGTGGQALITDGAGLLSWASASSNWQKIGTVLSPVNGSDDITTSGNIYTTGTGTITSAGLLTGNTGATILGGTTNINANSNFDTNINTGISTGAVRIGNSLAGVISIISGAALNLTGGATSGFSTTAGNIYLQPAGTGTTANVQVGAGGAGSATPDLLALDVKNTAGDPAGISGAMYFNAVSNTFRCFNGGWHNCSAAFLDTLLAATTANTINNGDNAQRWNWSLTTADKKAFTFGENTASTATGASAILHASTLAGSTAMPLFVENLGTGYSFRVDDSSGDTTPFIIDNTGHVLIGTNTFGTPKEKLRVEAGVTDSPAVISAQGSINDGLYVEVKNRNSGSIALSAFGATADDGDATTNFATFGIASSGYNNPIYPILGAHDAFLFNVGDFTGTQGGNMIIGTGEPGMSIKFISGGGASAANEQMRIDGAGNIGMGTTTPGSKLDVKGELRLSGATSGYVGFVPAAVAGSTTYTLPAVDGNAGYVLATDGAGVLSWGDVAGKFQRVGTVISPNIAGDHITTSGDIYTTGAGNIYTAGTGTITSAGLLTGSAGASISGAITDINVNSNFNTNINTGTSTGAVTIGNSTAGAINITSGAASSFSTTAGDINLQPGGSSTTAYVQIGAGGLGSTTPDLLALDVKSTAGDPAIGTDGAMYYNENSNTFRCHINGSWGACDTTGGTVTLQSAYNNGPTIDTHTSTDIAFTLTSGDFTASGAGSVDLTPTGASSFTSGGALTLTGGAASTWSTSAGALTLTSASAATWGTAAGDLTLTANGISTGNVKIGTGGLGSTTPDLLALDVKSDAGDPIGYNGAMYYNAFSGLFRCYEAGSWKNCGATGGAGGETLQQTYNLGGTITTSGGNPIAFTLTSGDFNVGGAGAVNLTPTSASQFTSGGALTLTGGAASTWSTTAGALTIDAGTTTPAALNLGTTNANAITIGKAGLTTVNLGPLQTGDATNTGSVKIADGSANYITLTSPAIAADYTLTLPVDAGTANQFLQTNGSGALFWGNPINPMTTEGDLAYYTAGAPARLAIGAAGTVLRSNGTDPVWAFLTSADVGLGNVTNVAQIPKAIGTAKGDMIAYTASNTPVRLPVGTNSQVLVSDSTQATGLRWANVSVADDSLDFAQFSDTMTVDANTSINMDGKNLTINDLTGGGALTLTAGAASTWGTSAGDLTLQSAGSGTTGAVKIGTGGVGSATPDLFGLDVKSTAGDPVGFNGAMYYNADIERFRCYQEGIWKDCDRSTLHTLQTIYNGGGTITTTGANIEFILANGDFTASGADSVLLNPTGASSFTSGGALTLTGGAASTWGTSAGNLSLQAAGTGTTAAVQIGAGGAGSTTPDYLALDVKSTTGDPAGGAEGYMYYNTFDNKFRCYENTAWKDCDAGIPKSIGTARGDLITYTGGSSPVRLPSGSNSQVLVSDSTQATGLRWADITVADDSLDFAQFKDLMTVDANTSVNLAGRNLTFNDLTGGGTLSLTTNAAPLTLTAGAASTWSTSSGALTIDSATALNLGTTTATSINIGRAGGGAIGLISPTGVNLNPYGAVAGNTTQLRFLELAANGVNYVSFKAPDSLAANTPYTLPNAYPGVSGYSLVSDLSGNLSWANVGGVLSGWTDNGTTVNLTTSTDNVHVGAGGAATAKMEITSDDSHTLRINPYGAAAGNTGNLEFMELAVNGTNYVGFKAPDNIATNAVWTLPSADGTIGQRLVTNGAGNLTWASAGSMPTGTINNATMRYDAGTTAWLENANILATAAGTITIAAGQSYTGAGAVTLSSAAASPLTVTSGTTGAINIGTDANAKVITIGNSTGATSLLLDAGTGGVKLGDSTSTPITRHLSATNTVDVAAIGNNSCNTFGTTVTGAAVGDTVVASPDNTAGGAGSLTNVTWSSYVSAANTVTVKVCKLGTATADPALETWRVDVWKH